MHRRSARHWPRSRPARPRCSTSIAPAPTPATSTSSSIGGRRNDATYCVPDRRAAELCAAAPTANPMNDLLSGPPLTTRRRGTVLVVDDEEGVRASIRAILEETCEVLEAEHGAAALDILAHREVDLVMLDQRMPGESGVDVLPRVKALDPSVVVVIATAVRDVRTAVEALKRGAYDYLIKPFEVDEIIGLADRVLEKRDLEREVVSLRSALAGGGAETSVGFEGLVGRHPEMARLYQLITQIAPTPTTVLITGESGTGKELVARAIHRRSDRQNAPFVAVNVAAIPETLVESELLGPERGALTGAHARRLGRFELAHGGTVFLDEIGSLRLELQSKLLRVLQEREVERVGGQRPVPVDVRVLAATNANLRAAVRERTFREDLFYRLNVVPLRLPSLRERREDIPHLVEHFVRKAACDRFERQYVLRVLERVQWNVSRAARLLGVHRKTVLAKLSAWGVQRPGGADRSASL